MRRGNPNKGFRVFYFPLSTDNNATATLTVTKAANGAHRWIAISSSAYRDRDGEIVSTKALEDDCARADADGNYGPLRWWHVKGLDIGTCDYNAMHGRMLVESGTFHDARIAEAIKEHAGELAVSIGFNHNATEPDSDGVFHTIKRFERSFLPRDKASNLFTAVGAVRKENNMTDEKKKALDEIVGDPAVVSDLITNAEATQKGADESGTAFKQWPSKAADDEECEDGDKECEDAKKAPKAEKKAARVKTVGQVPFDEFIAALGTVYQAANAQLLESTKAVKVEPTPNAENEALKARLAALEGDMPKFAAKATSVTADDSGVNDLIAALKEIAGGTATKQPTENDRLVENQMRALKAK